MGMAWLNDDGVLYLYDDDDDEVIVRRQKVINWCTYAYDQVIRSSEDEFLMG